MGKKSKNKNSARRTQKQKKSAHGIQNKNNNNNNNNNRNNNSATTKMNPMVGTNLNQSYNIMTKEGLSTETEIRDLLSSVEERPSEHYGKGLFLRRKVTKEQDGVVAVVVVKEGSRFKTINPKVGKLLIPFPFKLNSPLCPPWYELLLVDHNKNDIDDDDDDDDDDDKVVTTLYQLWMEFIEKERALANCWLYYEHDRLVKNASMKRLANFDEEDEEGKRFEFVRIKGIEVKFLKDLSCTGTGEELVRAYGHDWLCIKLCYLQRLMSNFHPAISRHVRFLMDMNLVEMLEFDIVLPEQAEDDLYPWYDRIEEAAAAAAADDNDNNEDAGRQLFVATMDDMGDWSNMIENVANKVLGLTTTNSTTSSSSSSNNNATDTDTKMFKMHWESTRDYLTIERSYIREEMTRNVKEMMMKKNMEHEE